MRFLVGLYLLGLGALVGCTDAVPIKFPEDGRVFSGVWVGSVFENPPPFEVFIGGNRVALSRSHELLVLDATTGQQVSRLGDFSGRVVGVSSDGSRVFEQEVGTLRVRDAATLQASRAFDLGAALVGNIQISRDGSRYLTLTNTEYRVSSTADGSLVRSAPIPNQSSGAQISSTGRYLLLTGYNGGQMDYRLLNLADGSSAPLPMPPTVQLSPVTVPRLEWITFSPDDTRLVGLWTTFDPRTQRLLVWNLSGNTLETTLTIPNSDQQSVRSLDWSATGDSGSLFAVSSSGSGLRYLHQPWTLQNMGQARDVTPLFSEYYKSGISPNSVTVLSAGEAYLLSYLEVESVIPDPRSPPAAPLIIKGTGVARVGSSAWNYKREAAFQSLRLEVQTQYLSTSEYTISGKASLDGQNFTVSGRGSGGGVRFFGGVEVQNQPPTLSIQLELISPTSQKAQISAYQFVSNGQSTAPPRYVGSYSGPSSPSLRLELQRP